MLSLRDPLQSRDTYKLKVRGCYDDHCTTINVINSLSNKIKNKIHANAFNDFGK